jgi:two-component system CheB/CheR fusion protein
VVGDVSAYCRIPEGRLTAAAGALLRPELQPEARTLFLLVRADRKIASSGLLHLPDRALALRLEAAPLQVGERALTVLSFIEQREGPSEAVAGLASTDRDAAFAREIERLERELLSSQDTLRRSMTDLEQANEELEASLEELQASSEELQSSNEELEASNEELQATNEELGTLNQQLRIRSDELERLNTDLENIQSSLSQGMVIVDRQLRVTRFSPLAVRVFGLVDSDIGQPLIGVPTTVPLPDLRDALVAVVHGEERRSIEATSEEVAYLAQVMPYRDREGTRLGAIITLTDVSELVALRRSAEAALREFASLADALEQAVWKRDHTMERILYMSRRIQQLTGWSAAELCHNPRLFDGAIHAEDQARVAAARHVSGTSWSVTYRLRRRDGQLSTLQETATVLDDGHDHAIVGTLSDVTEQHRLEQHSRLLAQGFETLIAHGNAAVALLDHSLCCVAASPGLAAALGSPPASLLSRSLDQLETSARSAGLQLVQLPLQASDQVLGSLLLAQIDRGDG